MMKFGLIKCILTIPRGDSVSNYRSRYHSAYLVVRQHTVKLTKIHVQIMRFMCCLSMDLNLKILKMSLEVFAHYADVFVCKNVAYGYDVVTKL